MIFPSTVTILIPQPFNHGAISCDTWKLNAYKQPRMLCIDIVFPVNRKFRARGDEFSPFRIHRQQ